MERGAVMGMGMGSLVSAGRRHVDTMGSDLLGEQLREADIGTSAMFVLLKRHRYLTCTPDATTGLALQGSGHVGLRHLTRPRWSRALSGYSTGSRGLAVRGSPHDRRITLGGLLCYDVVACSYLKGRRRLGKIESAVPHVSVGGVNSHLPVRENN